MPKDTFFNLPPAKRAKIIDVAIDEFYKYPFHKARITVIAEKAGIAKGSFYQYFEDKKDLFKYLVELMIEKKMSYINRKMLANHEQYDFFQLLREVYLSGIRFAKENPRLLPIGKMLANDKELYRDIFGNAEDKSTDFLGQLLEYGKRQEVIDPDINTPLVARMLTNISTSLVDFDYQDSKMNLDDQTIVDQILYLVANGIKKKNFAEGA